MLTVVAIPVVSWKLRAQVCHEPFHYLFDHRKYEPRPEARTMLLYCIDINNIIHIEFIPEDPALKQACDVEMLRSGYLYLYFTDTDSDRPAV